MELILLNEILSSLKKNCNETLLHYYYVMNTYYLSSYFAPTLREDPADAEFPSHKLLVRAGFIKPVGAGIYSLMPMGWRVVKKIEKILRQEMNRVGGQEVLLPVTQPAELWRESGRWNDVGAEMLRFKDRAERDMCLAMTHEESIVHMVRGYVKSYRQLPIMLYQIQTKFRDEPRPRGGLIRVREFTMKDAYSFHENEESLDEWYLKLYDAYERIFNRCGLEYIIVESDPGMMGGKIAHEFIAYSEFGEDTIIICPVCGYSANRQVARFKRDGAESEEIRPIEELATPGKESIEEVSEFLGVSPSKTCKAVFYMSEKRGLIFAVLRGDYEINETFLAKAIDDSNIRPARAEEIKACGAIAGYASPIGISGAFVVADTSLISERNLVAGANREGFHLRNVNIERDFKPDITAEIAAAHAGCKCIKCGNTLEAKRGIEAGNIFKLGTRYSSAMSALFLDRNGTEKPFVMGCYGIGSGRLMATVVEQSHDKDGIIWPENIAPFDVTVVLANEKAKIKLDELKSELEKAGVEALIDDRDLRPGIKFKDADLYGIPIRITMGRKVEEGIVELRERKTGEVQEVRISELSECIAKSRSKECV